jgi:hypothetical protein
LPAIKTLYFFHTQVNITSKKVIFMFLKQIFNGKRI